MAVDDVGVGTAQGEQAAHRAARQRGRRTPRGGRGLALARTDPGRRGNQSHEDAAPVARQEGGGGGGELFGGAARGGGRVGRGQERLDHKVGGRVGGHGRQIAPQESRVELGAQRARGSLKDGLEEVRPGAVARGGSRRRLLHHRQPRAVDRGVGDRAWHAQQARDEAVEQGPGGERGRRGLAPARRARRPPNPALSHRSLVSRRRPDQALHHEPAIRVPGEVGEAVGPGGG